MAEFSEQPPSTNRGVVRPDDRDGGGVDFLKLTVWCEAEEAKSVLESGVLDRYGWTVDPLRPVEDWIEKPAGGRSRWIHDGGCVSVVEFDDAVTQGSTFCAVEVKGVGCQHLGNEGILLLMRDFESRYRARPSRVDVMAHTEAFAPRTIHDAVKAGDFASRSVNADVLVFIESAAGDTCYLGMVSKPGGGLKRIGNRVLRVYNRRGPTRVELELCGDYAHGAGPTLLSTPLEEWPMLIRGMMRHYCDFVDRAADPRVTRCPLLPWWEEFVGTVEKISVRPEGPSLDGTPLGILDGILKNHVRRLAAGAQVFGVEWIAHRIAQHAKWEPTEAILQHAADLQPFLGTGLADVPGLDEEEPPF